MLFFFFNYTATTEIYTYWHTLSRHDALPIFFPWAPCTTTNADRTVHQGIEVGLDATIPLSALGDSLALTAAYTYSDFFFDDDAIYGDNRIPGVPKHYLRAELLYKHPGGFYAGPNVEWAPGHYYADNIVEAHTRRRLCRRRHRLHHCSMVVRGVDVTTSRRRQIGRAHV